MPTTVKTGWLKDKNGDKFAPKTLTSQVQTNDGVLLEDSMSAIASGAADDALLEANQYTDGKIALLMNNSSAAVDSIMELATAMKENDEVVGALEEAIGKKANSGDLTSHTTNTTVHITSDERTKWNAAKTHADSAHAPSDAEKNVQSDWNETNTSSDAFIKNKPTIPTVNNATLTIQKNGTNVATFTANSATNTTANITVPTGAAADKGVDTSISASSTSTNLPTSKAVAAFVEGKGYKTTDNNTTYDLAASTSSANGNVKLNLKAGGSGSGTDSVSIKGSGATTVTTDANGVITISSVEQKPVYVTLTLEMGGYSSDLTYSQIKSAHDAGSDIYCKVIGTNDYGISYGDFCLPLTRLGLGDNSFIFQGTFEARDEEAYNVTKGITVTINSVSNNVEFSTISHPQIYDFIEAKTEVKMKIWTTDDMGGT